MKNIQSTIVTIASSYVGIEEIPGNKGFKDAEFEAKMKACGFDPGDSWCVLFCELVWKEAYKKFNAQDTIQIIDKLFSDSALQTRNNFRENKKFVIDTIPEIGSIVIWQNISEGKVQWTGHAAIVKEIYPEHIMTIEGNTNDKGGREGYIVAIRSRKLNFDLQIQNGLKMKCFIHPINV